MLDQSPRGKSSASNMLMWHYLEEEYHDSTSFNSSQTLFSQNNMSAQKDLAKGNLFNLLGQEILFEVRYMRNEKNQTKTLETQRKTKFSHVSFGCQSVKMEEEPVNLCQQDIFSLSQPTSSQENKCFVMQTQTKSISIRNIKNINHSLKSRRKRRKTLNIKQCVYQSQALLSSCLTDLTKTALNLIKQAKSVTFNQIYNSLAINLQHSDQAISHLSLRRRTYDIINVFEGCQIIKKVSQNKMAFDNQRKLKLTKNTQINKMRTIFEDRKKILLRKAEYLYFVCLQSNRVNKINESYYFLDMKKRLFNMKLK